MKGNKTVIVLGAGASYCYENGSSNIPIQKDILSRLFFQCSTSSGQGFPTFISTYGLQHSFALGQYLRQKYSFPEDQNENNEKLSFWKDLQSTGYTLEKLYEEMEQDLIGKSTHLVYDFEAIVRTAVSIPTGERDINNVCNNHRKLVEALEPGDCIINFNWDCLVADALLYHSPLWFPETGFGPIPMFPVSNFNSKNYRLNSYIDLLQIHGSVLLYELLEKPKNVKVPRFIYLGPKTQNNIGSIKKLIEDRKGLELTGGKDKEDSMSSMKVLIEDHKGFELLKDEDMDKLNWGCHYIFGEWYKPIFLPPTRYKKENESNYCRTIRKWIYQHLIYTKNIVIIGYSAPKSDLEHLFTLFPTNLIDEDTKLTIINADNDKDDFKDRYKLIFPRINKFQFGESDFKVWVNSLNI